MLINNDTIIKDNDPLIRQKSEPVELPLSAEDETLLREMLQYVKDSTDEEKAKIVRNIHILFIIAMVFMAILIATNFIDAIDGHLRDFLTGMSMGIGFGMIVVGAVMTSKYAKDIRDFKMRLIGRGKDK